MTVMDLDAYLSLSNDEREQHIESLDTEARLCLGADLYNAEHFWHAHEAWEAIWLDAPAPLRDLYQGLIQVAAAFVHVKRDEYPGSVRLLDSGISKLAPYGRAREGVELAAFVEGARRAREALLSLGEKRISEFDRGLIPPVVLKSTDS
jgi:predicted metal-dependent hydrolase